MSVIPSLPFSPVLLPICPWFTVRMYDSGFLSIHWWIQSFSFFVLPELLLSAIICPLCHYIKAMMSEVQVFIKQLWVHNCQKSPDQRIHQPSNLATITHGVTWVSFTSSNSIRLLESRSQLFSYIYNNILHNYGYAHLPRASQVVQW